MNKPFSLFHKWQLLKESFVLKHLFILALQEFFQAINVHFTQTTEHQPTGNLHSSTKPAASHFNAYLPASVRKYQDIRKYSQGKWPTDSNWSLGSSPHFEAWLLSTHVYCFNRLRFQLHGAFRSDNLEKKKALREHLKFFMVKLTHKININYDKWNFAI